MVAGGLDLAQGSEELRSRDARDGFAPQVVEQKSEEPACFGDSDRRQLVGSQPQPLMGDRCEGIATARLLGLANLGRVRSVRHE